MPEEWKIRLRGVGRIALDLRARRAGADLLILIYGGAAHIGALALADADGSGSVIVAAGHREGEIALRAAKRAAAVLETRAAVACGIHFSAITPAEIEDVVSLADELLNKLLDVMGGAMFNKMKTIDELREYLDSGKFAEDFKEAGEYEKGAMLDALEQIMDLGDLADEVATRIIYRGLAPLAEKEE